jgi:DNA-binding transcriptional MerR regulator
METLSIGQVAKRAGVGVETARFRNRRVSGYRQFSKEASRC